MLRILKVSVTGFRHLCDGFSVDLLNRTRVTSEDLTGDVLDLENRLYSFKYLAFIGGNASGKSTTLSLLLYCYRFLLEGRWPFSGKDLPNGELKLHIEFLLQHRVYFYDAVLCSPTDGTDSSFHKSMFCTIKEEHLEYVEYRMDMGKHYDEAKRIPYDLQKAIKDTSAITILTDNGVYVDDFGNNNIGSFGYSMVRESFFDSLRDTKIGLTSAILKLLDEDIEYIRILNADMAEMKRFHHAPVTLNKMELMMILSNGTIRGSELFIRAIKVLKAGGVLIVDEIENCFHKNLVDNLIFLFKDSEINRNGAQLLFSTHYSQILDVFNRRDSIFILHKREGVIRIENMWETYRLRSELLKSNAFDENTFDTLLNYDQLMKVREMIVDELHSDHDGRSD